MSEELTVIEGGILTTVEETTAVMPAMSIQQAMERRNQISAFVSSIMKDGIDYGVVPGAREKTLLKPGAERLTTFFGLSPRFTILDRVEDWTGQEHGGEPFFYYLYRCHLYRGDVLVAEADGSCNSMESKYRYRWVPETEVPSHLDKSMLKQRSGIVSEFDFAIREGKTTGKYGQPPEYWQAFRDAITNGTARKTERQKRDGTRLPATEINMTKFRVPNPEIASLVNTLLKMGQKRALVAATLVAVNASEYFTQDLEDMADSGVSPYPQAVAPDGKAFAPVKKVVVPEEVKKEFEEEKNAPKDMNELYEMAEAAGYKRGEAIQHITKQTGCKTVKEAMDQGWDVSDFWKLFLEEGTQESTTNHAYEEEGPDTEQLEF